MRSALILSMAIIVGGLVACGAVPQANGNADAATGSAKSEEVAVVESTEQPLHQLPVGTRWQLAETARPALQLAEAAQVTLGIDGDRLHGDSSCNQYSADYTINDGRIELGPIAATKRGCPGPRSDVERAWFEALGSVQWISRDGDGLLLRLADGDAIRMIAAPLATE